MNADASIPHEQALLLLNDHCGQEAEVMVQLRGLEILGTAPTTMFVMSAKGILRQWREDPHEGQASAGDPREDITGIYNLGDAIIDITDLPRAAPLNLDKETVGLEFELKEGVSMSVVWGYGS
jgi:hypothetical protein